ncbi:hypothetical protein LIER_01045 [Lithospermum erythrorhizon]|uniref:DUF4283 domain-containing protein n=1 Tax=Lithospermum erythrorhizon TaxID=34254 RepID=A0AAV3NP32_LITER
MLITVFGGFVLSVASMRLDVEIWILIFWNFFADPPQGPDPLCLLNIQVKAQEGALLAGAGAQAAAEVHPGSRHHSFAHHHRFYTLLNPDCPLFATGCKLMWIAAGSFEVLWTSKEESPFYLFNFSMKEDMDDVVPRSPLNVNGALLILQHWTPNIVFSNFDISHTNLWIHIHGILAAYFEESNVRRLARVAGDIVVLDWYSISAQALHFVRVKVRVPLAAHIVSGRIYGSPSGMKLSLELVINVVVLDILSFIIVIMLILPSITSLNTSTTTTSITISLIMTPPFTIKGLEPAPILMFTGIPQSTSSTLLLITLMTTIAMKIKAITTTLMTSDHNNSPLHSEDFGSEAAQIFELQTELAAQQSLDEY